MRVAQIFMQGVGNCLEGDEKATEEWELCWEEGGRLLGDIKLDSSEQLGGRKH